jgi:DNA-binding XRE family transcriptional regulator
LEKQMLSATSKERRCAGDPFLGRCPCLLVSTYASSARFGTSSVKDLSTTRRVRMMERSRSIPLPGLTEHRQRRGLTQRQLGKLAGVAHTTVQQLESLRRGAYPQTMQKLATALGIAPEELLYGESTER